VHNWQFAYLHILFSEISVTLNAAIVWPVTFYLLIMQQCTVPSTALINVAEILLNVARNSKDAMRNLHFARFCHL